MVNIDQTTGSRGKHNQPLATLASYRRQKVVKVHISYFLLDFALFIRSFRGFLDYYNASLFFFFMSFSIKQNDDTLLQGKIMFGILLVQEKTGLEDFEHYELEVESTKWLRTRYTRLLVVGSNVSITRHVQTR
jgi:hypothetical protein